MSSKGKSETKTFRPPGKSISIINTETTFKRFLQIGRCPWNLVFTLTNGTIGLLTKIKEIVIRVTPPTENNCRLRQNDVKFLYHYGS